MRPRPAVLGGMPRYLPCCIAEPAPPHMVEQQGCSGFFALAFSSQLHSSLVLCLSGAGSRPMHTHKSAYTLVSLGIHPTDLSTFSWLNVS
jgi:hypothetical protein